MSEKLQIKLHKLICNCCKNYEPDSDVVNELLRILNEEDNSPAFSEDEKQQLKDVLNSLS